MTDNNKFTGKYLNEIWNVGAKHALYHKDSSWYHVLEKFPGALFDPNGYILFATRADYENCEYLRIGKHLSVPGGIFSIPGYVLVEKQNANISRTLSTKEPDPIWTVKKPKNRSKQNKNLSLPVTDLGEPEPSRIKTTTYRILRDTLLAQKIKALHDYECQICGLTVELRNGQRYIEAHHIKPLGSPHNGPDIAENIICVCPNHHAQLDYAAIKLNLSALRILNEHPIGEEFINYHNEIIFDQTA